MASQIRSVDLLPEIFQTPVNRQLFNATLDQLTQNPKFVKTQGFIGRRVGPGVNPEDKYVVEPTKSRTNYQLEPGVIELNPENSSEIVNAITYPGITDALKLQGAQTDNANRLYLSDYYAFDPFVDFDKFVNYNEYYWLPDGPDAVDVSSTGVPLTDNFVVTRANGVYTFSGIAGDNPVLTLARGGSYTFQVAQNNSESENFRVQNNGTQAYLIDYLANPTLTLVRGNTYVFQLSLTGPFPFYIKTIASLGNVNLYSTGVQNNGAITGSVTFTVPQSAPNTLYYAAGNQVNMQGTINIVDPINPIGPGFWIQTDPGVNGKIPSTPNISSRDVLGVTNNGEDLGTVTFNVPFVNAQNFFYDPPAGSLTTIPGVDLVTNIGFGQINNQYVDQFLSNFPTGIDGVNSPSILNGKTVIFIDQQNNITNGLWEITSLFDPLPNVGNVVSGSGSYDSLPYDQTIPITDPEVIYSIWQISVLTDGDGRQYFSLSSVRLVNESEKFSIIFGNQYSNTSWYKTPQATFTQVPLLTAVRDVLYYQDGTDPEIFGQIRIIDQNDSSIINIDNIIGRTNYVSPNGVTFTNGLKVIFRGQVEPASYQNNEYYVEGVGTGIRLLPVTNFITPEHYADQNYPDYITINRASPDLNPWSRSNRWFHKNVIDLSAFYNNTIPVFDNLQKGRRPIIEFRAGIRLFDFGTEGKQPVNVLDFDTTDAFSQINGTLGYTIDGYTLEQGSRVIFAADEDLNVRNKIYTVEFIVPDTVSPLIPQPIINLVEASDNDVLIDQSVVCLSGSTHNGITFYYNGIEWAESQQKMGWNQAPLFNVYDKNGISFGDSTYYPSTNFRGSKLFSYAEGSGITDPVLNFALTYFSLANIGDIVFDNNLYKDTFNYTVESVGQTQPISNGFVREYLNRIEFHREIGWQSAITPSLVRQQFQFTYDGNPIDLDVKALTNSVVPSVQVYVNSKFQSPLTYTVTTTDTTTTINWLVTHVPGDVVEVAVLSEQISDSGFYQVPINIENNPLNANSPTFTLGTIRGHYETICQNLLGLVGPIIGANNIRDLGNIIPYGLQILQQSSPLTLTGYFQRNTQFDIYAALEYNSREYIKFKSQLLETVTRNEYPNLSIAEILDSAVREITVGRTNLNPFYWSDMLPSGMQYTETATVVTNTTTLVFDTNQIYTYTSANYQGLLVYLTIPVPSQESVTVLLTRGVDYVVSSDAPKLTILTPLEYGSVVTIKEYSNTFGNFVPNTPTKLGLYPKFLPKQFVDTNYVNPVPVIQGHDGSITVAFGDIRDLILLEFETRIYNNLKTDDNPVPLTLDQVQPGQFRKTDYSQDEINNILAESFLTWVGYNKLDYKTQDFVTNNPFTFNYSSSGAKINSQGELSNVGETPLLGAWRGIYRYFYDTTSPNTTPWEMLGLSEQPVWWEDRYGPAPYTSDNLVLWHDLSNGYVADPVAPYVNPLCVRPGLLNVIPVNSQGDLVSPLDSVVGQFDSYSIRKSWAVGDGGPVEASWWASSSYPFAVMRVLALTRPAEFFSLFADRDLYRYSEEFDQYLYNGRYRLDANGIQIYGNGVSKASYIDWIVDYNQQLGINSTDTLTEALKNLDVRLCYRMGSFSDKQYIKLYTEMSRPSSQNASLLLPPESYNLFLYKNQPFNKITYSSLIIEKVNDGYAVYGYSNSKPYFEILSSQASGATQSIASGSVTVRVPTQYTSNVVQIPYGYVFTNETVVVDFILSYGAYLTSQGLVFDNVENGYTLNWMQMAQEFLYFSSQGWAAGTLINLNPSATRLSAVRPGEVVDTIVSVTPENMLLNQNRSTLPTRDLIINREGNNFDITSPTGQTISYLDLRFTSYESIIVLDNESIFRDLIYDPITGLRQSRIKLVGSTSSDWNGNLDAQGFILNQNNVRQWQSNRKYTKGEIVLYKNQYWQALNIVQPKAEFDYADWSVSNYERIQTGLLPNIANKADQLANSYNVYTANLNVDNDLLSYGLIGFRRRQYMAALDLDDSTQVQLYQGFLGSKGTLLSAELFTRADLGKESGSYSIYENWAILAGTYGAQANESYIEIQLNEADLPSNPSTLQIIQNRQISEADQTVPLADLWSTSYQLTSTNIFTTKYLDLTSTELPNAGYVKIEDADINVFSLENPEAISANIEIVGIGTTIWVAKTNSYDWNIYTCERVPGQMTLLSDNLNGTSTVQFNSAHRLSRNDLIVIRYFNDSVNGVYRVLSTPTISTITVAYSFENTNQLNVGGDGLVFYLQTARVSQASDVINLPYANDLYPGAKVWVDNNGDGQWSVLQKQNPFDQFNDLSSSPPVANSLYGAALAQSNNNVAALVGSPGRGAPGTVYTYRRGPLGQYVDNVPLTLNAVDTLGFGNSLDFGSTNWAVAGASQSNSGAGYVASIYLIPGSNDYEIVQLLVAPDGDFTAINFGASLSISDDQRWLYVAAPAANKVYAYGQVPVEIQQVEYTADGTTTGFQFSNVIQINSSNPDQLLVTVNGYVVSNPTDYTINTDFVLFNTAPLAGSTVSIRRRQIADYIGDGITDTYQLDTYLYTAQDIYSFTVTVNSVIQRPLIDYTFAYPTVTLNTPPPAGQGVRITSGTHWKYVSQLPTAGLGLASGDQFGASISTSNRGQQILVGAPRAAVDGIRSGAVYAYDRSAIQYVITNPSQLTYAIAGSYTEPVNVILNNIYLTNTSQSVSGQFTVSGSDIILSPEVSLNIGDTLEIETNQFNVIQTINQLDSAEEGAFGQAVKICHTECSVYTGAPLAMNDNLLQAGLVQANVNQSRVYGITTSTVANPTLTAGDTLRINNVEVAVPSGLNQNIQGLIAAINSANVPNAMATATPDLTLIGDGTTKIFDIGTVYSSALSYTTVVYIDDVLQTSGVNYSYNNTTKQLTFTIAPNLDAVIVVVSGRMTVSVKNIAASVPSQRLSVLPGTTGSAFDDVGFTTYAYTQTIYSPTPTDYAYFGSSIDVDNNSISLVIGAPNGNIYEQMLFDGGETYFDDRSTTFFTPIINSGVAYTYDYLPSAIKSIDNHGKFVFGQQIYTSSTTPGDQFGYAINYTSQRLMVGIPGNDSGDLSGNYGLVTTFDNTDNRQSWTVLQSQTPVVDVDLINSVFSFGAYPGQTQTYYDFIDPLQGKILGVARRNIDYVGAVDPASYNQGPVHNLGNSWGQEHVGEIWWDTDTVRFIDPSQDNLPYASRRWAQTFPGSQIDIYQWVEASVPPVNYTGPGIPLSTVSYTVSSSLDTSGVIRPSYYFWVRGLSSVSVQKGKTLSPTAIASYIESPRSSGIPYIAAISANSIALYNFKELVSAADTILHIGYDRQATSANIHTEYNLIKDGAADSFLNDNLYRKLQDSFCGSDEAGNQVPDVGLPIAQRYGVQFRPRQSMFADRFMALQNYLTHVNNVLLTVPVAENRIFRLLNSSEPEPLPNTGAWNKKVANLEELGYQNLSQIPVGYRYLVESDSTQDGRWTIYELQVGITANEKILDLIRVQNYNTREYWSYVDWYLPGYNSSVNPVASVPYYAGLSTLTLSAAPIGRSVKVLNNGQGKFEIYQRTVDGWALVGIENGTIQVSESLWNYSLGPYGFDAEVFDSQYFDKSPIIETRKIIQAINEELFINELQIERNRALMLMFDFIYTEFTAPDWLVKTSLIDVDHKIRKLIPYSMYMQDNQTFVLDYLQEVKPYHVQVRQFNLMYDGIDDYPGNLTDFDVPAYWDTSQVIPQFISPVLTPYTGSRSRIESINSDATPNSEIWTKDPWAQWFNNYLLYLESVTITKSGYGYLVAPVLEVSPPTTPDGITATMTAIINSQGQVVNIVVTNPGSGYITVPTITITGGGLPSNTTEYDSGLSVFGNQNIITPANDIFEVEVAGTLSGMPPEIPDPVTVPVVNGTAILRYVGTVASVAASLGNNTVRSIRTVVKYNRCEYISDIVDWQPNVIYNTGDRVRYLDQVWEATVTGSSPVFNPTEWFKVSADTLSAADRTMGFYTPTLNMPGLSLPLLIDGIDYPGVQVQGLNFDQTAGFDVASFDTSPFDSYFLDENGQPTVDPALYDTLYNSSYLDPYLGIRPTDVNVDGGNYINAASSHAPEELVLGSEFDTLDLRVYTATWNPTTGSASDGFVPVNGDGIVDQQYLVSETGTYDFGAGTIAVFVGDLIKYDGSTWNVVSGVYSTPSLNFRIFQDMRGIQATYRITDSTTTELTQELLTDDEVIYVNDASALMIPNLSTNLWGVLTINGERIMYRELDLVTNTVSGLLRGTAGTAIDSYASGSTVYNLSRENLQPNQPVVYQNYIESNSMLADGIETTFVATDVAVDSGNEDAVEVYVGGIRMLSDYTITNNMSVTVVFDTPPADGVEVTILVKLGVTWYNPGMSTPSNGTALAETFNEAARFLRGA